MSAQTVSETTSLIPQEVHGLTRSRVILLMAALYFGVMLAALDTTIVTTLMAHIASDLKALDSVSWVATGYTVAYSAFQPLYGKFSDIWGRKHVSIFCTFMFGLGCLMCGTSKGLSMLVAGRFVSGFGAGGMLSMSTVTISDYVPLRSRGIFQGIGNVAFGTGASLGGLLGGWFTELGGWRLAFNVQVPLAVISVIAQWWLLKENPLSTHPDDLPSQSARSNVWKRIDWVGSISLVSALLLSMIAITTGGNQFSWISVPVLGSFVGAGLLMYLFLYWETNRAIEPVIPLPVLMNRTVFYACVTNFFGTGMAYAFLFYSPLFLQAMCGYTYREIGHRVVVNFVGVASGSLGAGIYMRRTGRYYNLGLLCGVSVLVASFMLMISPWLGVRYSHSALYQSITYLLNGLGYAGMLTITLTAIISAVEPKFQATATASQYTFRGAGSSLGIALAAAIFQNTLGYELEKDVYDGTTKSRKVIKKVSKSLEAIWTVPKKYKSQVVHSYTIAGVAVEAFCLVWGVLSLGTTSLIHEHDLERNPSTVATSDEQRSTDSDNINSEP